MEKALSRTTQQKLRESLHPAANLDDFVVAATHIKDARLLFSPQNRDLPTATTNTEDSLATIHRELEALKLQRSLQEELSSGRRTVKNQGEGLLAKV